MKPAEDIKPKVRNPQLNIIDKLNLELQQRFRRHFGEMERMQAKASGQRDYAQKVEAELASLIEYELQKSGHPVLGPQTEAKDIPTEGKAWLYIPLFGRANFAHALSPCGSLFVYLVDGAAQVGALTFPLEDRLVTAVRGESAVERMRLRVSGRDKLDGSLIQFPQRHICDEGFTFMEKLKDAHADIRINACIEASIADVAAGRADGLTMRGAHPFSILLADLVIREAGGYVTDHKSRMVSPGTSEICAGNPKIHAFLLKILAKL